MRPKTACFCSVFLLLTACATRHQRLAQTMPSWVGKPVAEVIQVWGPPSTVYDDGPGKVYVWHEHVVRTVGGGGGRVRPDGRISADPTVTINRNYYRMFWVNKDGVIVRWKAGAN